MERACKSESPVEKMKYVVTSIISSAYYMNMFLKPVMVFLLSLILLLERLSRVHTQMEPKSTVNKYPTILLLATSFLSVPITPLGIQAITHLKQMQG